MEVHTIRDVRRVYKHFKILYADASHVMMAYRLPGTNTAYDSDYYDDGENGGGRRLFRILNDNDALSTMLIVVRYQSEMLLGPQRFQNIHDVAEEALGLMQEGRFQQSILKLQSATQPMRSKSIPFSKGIQPTSTATAATLRQLPP